MGVDLTLIALDLSTRSAMRYVTQRRSSMWPLIRELPSEPAPSLETIDIYDIVWVPKGHRKRGPRVEFVRERRKVPAGPLLLVGEDCYGKPLRAIQCQQLRDLLDYTPDHDWRLEERLSWDELFAEVRPETPLILYWS